MSWLDGKQTHFTLEQTMWTQHCFILTVFTSKVILFYKVWTSPECYKVYKSRRNKEKWGFVCFFLERSGLMGFCEGPGNHKMI